MSSFYEEINPMILSPSFTSQKKEVGIEIGENYNVER